jgi:hypothetical protein
MLDFPEVSIPIVGTWKITVSCDSEMLQFKLRDLDQKKTVSCAMSDQDCEAVIAAMNLILRHLRMQDEE